MRNIIEKFVWLVVLLESVSFGALSSVYALDPRKTIAQYGHSVWLRENGLPSNAVNVALQTHDGYLWFGTSAGLFRFDGVNFNEVSTSPRNNMIHETVTALYESRDSSLWIGTAYSGLRRFKNGRMYVYGRNQGFYDTQVWSLLEDRAGHILIGTSIGAYMYDGRNFTTILANPNYVSCICEDSVGRIWIGTYSGVRVLSEKSIASNYRNVPMNSITKAEGLPNDAVTYLFTDHQGRVWIGTFDGLARYSEGKIISFSAYTGLSSSHIYAISEDHNGNLWVGTQKGLDRYYGGKWAAYTRSDGLTDDNAVSIVEDREGCLWVCTANGLNQFRNANITTYTTQEGLANDHISSIVETPDGSLYFLSDQGASVTRLFSGKVTRYDISVGPAYVARDGSLWIGQSGILYRIKNGVLTTCPFQLGMPLKWISAITEDSRSLILYVDHSGLFRFVNGRLEPYRTKIGEEYPAAEAVTCFCWQGNVLWIGAADSLMKMENGKIVGYTTADGLAGNWVSSIFDDRQGNLWISSPQGGLSRFRNGKFTVYDTRVGLFTDEIYCVLGDDEGGIWLSSPRGIGYLSEQELNDFADGRTDTIHSRTYVTADGMKTDECFGGWQPAGWKARNGHLWFATKKGAAMIDPNAFKRNKLPPPVFIEQIIADQQTMPSTHSASLPPGIKKLEFHYTALSFPMPERVSFKYKLDGYDHEWVDAGSRREAYYTNLPPGNYRFLVIACNNDGVWNETGASFDFVLQPHFYETYWFLGLLVIIIVSGAFGAYRLRVWQLLQKEKELSKRIQDAMANIKTLGGLIPICSNCKKIRDDKGYWEQLEGYIQTHSEAQFSHGICPECAAKLYPQIYPGSDTRKGPAGVPPRS